MYSEPDHHFMARALELGARALVHSAPNPRVGCVLVRDGRVLGEGWTQTPGSNHAEVEALLDARAQGHEAQGATAYVTLEPCSHFGRTPPCAKALIEARIARVIAAVEDPNPLVSGRGLQQLREAGIEVRCGLLREQAIEANVGFFARMNRGRPWVRLKIAASLDGRTALASGASQWITGEAARTDGHAWRARSCAVMTGSGTARFDNPRLSVRRVPTSRQPLKVLVDSQLQIDPGARLFDGLPVLVACARGDPGRAAHLRQRQAEVIELPDLAGRVDLRLLLAELGRREVNELLVEAGPRLNGALLEAGLVDELLLYYAPMLIGPGQAMIETAPLALLADARRLEVREAGPVGGDLRVLARLT